MGVRSDAIVAVTADILIRALWKIAGLPEVENALNGPKKKQAQPSCSSKTING
eukprot:m.18049 g.18049  ORF g.18049 m.18049 type:complete len:53 (-) comp7664_c0_seq1:269-427(-)